MMSGNQTLKSARKQLRTPKLCVYAAVAAALAAGAAHASGPYLSAGGEPVRSGAGDCWRTGAWTASEATRACDPLLAAAPERLVIAPAPVKELPKVEEPAPMVAASGSTSGIREIREPQSFSFTTQVLFDFGDATVRDEGRKVLDDLAQRLLASELQRVAATAHADRVGDDAYNERLALRRAEAIRTYLVGQGVPEKLVQVDARGEHEPVTAGRCDAMGPERRANVKLVSCLQPDRRVEIEAFGVR